MGLRAFVRRHHNVFSYTNEWVDADSDAVVDLEEEYGEQADSEARINAPAPIVRMRPWFLRPTYLLRARMGIPQDSVDGILEIGKDSEDEKKPRS